MKAGEDKWLGLSDWLKGQKDKKSLTKQEVMDYIRQNQVQVEEVNYAEGSREAYNYKNLFLFTRQMTTEALAISREEGISIQEAFERLKERYGDRMDEYVEQDDMGLIHPVEYVDEKEALEYFNQEIVKNEVKPIDSTRLEYSTQGLQNKREIALTVPTVEPYNEYDNIHFGDAGGGRAVAWVRFGETTDKDGKRVLVIDEIQSKRHQDGREKGYDNSKRINEIKKRREELDNKIRNGEDLTDAEYEELEMLAKEQRELMSSNAVPDAPFEKNWHELAMKRMLRYAAENGYDKIAWTTGEQQADRYNLGGVVSEVQSYVNDDGSLHVMINFKQGNGLVCDVDNNGTIVSTNGNTQGIITEGNPLHEVVGKELSQKILNGDGVLVQNKFVTDREVRELSGDNLRIGGEGMKGFYDQILPRFMDKYGKKWGVKTGEVELPDVEEDGRRMHSVDVTPEMKESVMQGQPMFSLSEDPMEAIERAARAFREERTLMGVHNISEDKKTTSSERGGVISGNPSAESLPSEGGGHLSHSALTLPKDAAKLRKNSETTLSSARKIQNEGGLKKEINIPEQAVRALGSGLHLEKSASSQSYYRDYYEGSQASC